MCPRHNKAETLSFTVNAAGKFGSSTGATFNNYGDFTKTDSSYTLFEWGFNNHDDVVLQQGSLELALDENDVFGSCDLGFSCQYTRPISWRDQLAPLPMDTNDVLGFVMSLSFCIIP